ncbi:peroxisome proliferator-activated receptor gamma coactivator-related protein like protein [Tanacetum coccineum]
MALPLFNWIVDEVTNHSSFFRDNIDCTGKEGLSPLLKCTSAIRQLAYGINADFLDEYLSGFVVRIPLKGNMLDVIMIPFVANDVTYPWGCYLVDGIYPKLATLVKTIPKPADDDNKGILYKLKHDSARKDLKRAFGVLKKK